MMISPAFTLSRSPEDCAEKMLTGSAGTLWLSGMSWKQSAVGALLQGIARGGEHSRRRPMVVQAESQDRLVECSLANAEI